MPYLDPTAHTYVFADARGYGTSRHLTGAYTADEMASDAFRLVDELGWTRFHVVGHSMTGLVAQRMAVDDWNSGIRRIKTVVAVTPGEIDLINIHQATLQAMRRAVLALAPLPDAVLVDAFRIPSLPMAQRGVIGGDRRSAAIAAATATTVLIVAAAARIAWRASPARAARIAIHAGIDLRTAVVDQARCAGDAFRFEAALAFAARACASDRACDRAVVKAPIRTVQQWRAIGRDEGHAAAAKASIAGIDIEACHGHRTRGL
ncbi:MAG: alpha/beta fold hydrolase [Brachymonas sp.]|nr:alpha/beta fold hydrolase [Brachymonas sp.]